MLLYNDDCLNVLKTMESNSIDSVITDPPYGISFMAKKWDYDVPSVELWKEVLRVMKPGATLLCFAGSRTQHRMAVNIEDAGFILKDTIMWLYGSGFPKATDISKQIDKIKGVWKEREVIGKAKGVGKQNPKWNGVEGGRSQNYLKPEYNVTKPATEEAEKWDGWKSHGLKPAYEPVIMAMKPNEGSYAQNALKWGVSGVNIDECRISWDENDPNKRPNSKNHIRKSGVYGGSSLFESKTRHLSDYGIGIDYSKGRYPANVILSHHPECEYLGMKKVKAHTIGNKSKERLSSSNGILDIKERNNIFDYSKNGKEEVENWNCHEDCPTKILDDQSGEILTGGSASRFFYCAKATKSERNKGVEKNQHPTVKPIKLMEYLCKLISMPEKTIVLDPFMGSGTTGIACINVGLDFIGIERKREYFEIAQARLDYIKEEIIDKPKKAKDAIEIFFGKGEKNASL